MKSVKNLLIVLVAGAVVAGCTKATYRKTAGGMPYQLYKGADTQRIFSGNILKLSFTQKVNDSVYFTNVGNPPFYSPVNEQTMPYDLSELWTKMKVGDSVVAIQMMDTFIKRNPDLSKHYKRGDRIITLVKILAAFKSNQEATDDETKELQNWKKKEAEQLGKYIADKKINAQKTPSGAYVQIINPGTGDLIDSGNYVYVNYTGTSFSGKRFDSNTDTAFHHTEPYPFTAGHAEMISGFDEAVMFMRKGAVAKAWIPSTLAYGPKPGTPLIKPYENLIFDIEIVDVKEKAPGRAEEEQERRKKVDTPQPNK